MPDRFGRVVTPIFREVRARELEFGGSAILIAGPDGGSWLVSASHVFAEMDETSLVIGATESDYLYVVADGPVLSTCELSPENAAVDRKDLAFVKLHKAIGELIVQKGFALLPLRYIEHSYQTPGEQLCVLVGYPSEHAVVEDGRPLALTELRTQSALLPDAKVRLRHKLDPLHHIVAQFGPMENDQCERIATPRPDGMSGGAIFTYHGHELLLSAVIIEHDKGRREIVGTRIGPVIKEIIRRTPESLPS